MVTFYLKYFFLLFLHHHPTPPLPTPSNYTPSLPSIQIFSTWISLLDSVLTPLLTWPSRRKVDKHMPPSVKKNYPKTRVILDCSEFFIQRPRQPTPQSTTYSTYKSHNTFKVLYGITPSGAFSFVSKLWGGNVSDRHIVQHSGILDKLEPGDEVMADRGFNIRDLMLSKKCTLTIPSYTRKCGYGSGKRLNVKEIRTSRNISRFRIHVERAIGRAKQWKITQNVMPLSIKPIVTKIIRVISFFCNMKLPLLNK